MACCCEKRMEGNEEEGRRRTCRRKGSGNRHACVDYESVNGRRGGRNDILDAR